MKKRIIAILLALMTAFVFTGCTGSDDGGYNGSDDGSDDGRIVVISERFFVLELMEVLLNHQQYMGRTIRLEGMFRTMDESGVDRFAVMRYTWTCCSEEPFGVEVVLGDFPPFADNAWVEVTGTLAVYNDFLVLKVTSITELARRGAEVV